MCPACSPVEPWDGHDECPYCGYHKPPERTFTERELREVLREFTVAPIAAGISAGASRRYGRTATDVAQRIAARFGIDLDAGD